MKKLQWKRDYAEEELMPRWSDEQRWKASWFVLYFQVFSVNGKWAYFIYGNNRLKSNPDKMFETKEDAFQAVEDRLERAIRELV